MLEGGPGPRVQSRINNDDGQGTLLLPIVGKRMMEEVARGQLCLLFIHPPAHGSEVSPAARNTLDSARIPRASKLLICGLFLKGRVLAQDAVVACALAYHAFRTGRAPGDYGITI